MNKEGEKMKSTISLYTFADLKRLELEGQKENICELFMDYYKENNTDDYSVKNNNGWVPLKKYLQDKGFEYGKDGWNLSDAADLWNEFQKGWGVVSFPTHNIHY